MCLVDYIFQTLADYSVRPIFMLTGSGSMLLKDAIGQEPHIENVFNQNEQVIAIAAEGCARITNTPGVVKCHIRSWRNQCAEWRLWCLDGFDPNAGYFRPGQTRDLHA